MILDAALHFFTIFVYIVNRGNLVSHKSIEKYSPSLLLKSYCMFTDIAQLTYIHLYFLLMLQALLYYLAYYM